MSEETNFVLLIAKLVTLCRPHDRRAKLIKSPPMA
jgi:hypothetical protein